ncbi:MAG: hypothetical protein CMK09_18425 [Ponticaulis sp.]|nr:hypothetical protein [Ponticaulis sp.]|tara:strand:- start:57343 stop:57834 length:492 start_codon:yes stop_codon:yes gene_type:complete
MMRRAIIILVLTICLLGGMSSGAEDKTPVSAPDIFALSATPLNDAPEFSELSGQITLLILFQPHCAWCPLQFRAADELKRTRANWLQIAAVSRQGSIPQLLHELDRYGVDFPAYQSSEALLEALKYTPGTPCIYLIAADGHLGQYTCGRKTPDELVKFLMGKL